MAGLKVYNLRGYLDMLQKENQLLVVDEEVDAVTKMKVAGKYAAMFPARYR